jgi:hypothetical protein
MDGTVSAWILIKADKTGFYSRGSAESVERQFLHNNVQQQLDSVIF